MTQKENKINNDVVNTLQLVDENEIAEGKEFNAEASLMLNPYVRWAKFILTDNQPNGNNERVREDEFDNLILSGIHMPIKMAEGKIEDDHSNASPIGVITHLKREVVDGVHRIIGLAALWLRERPSDVSYLKERLENGEEVNISWEMGASERVLSDDGVFDWKDVALQAATVVNRPAYKGRTRFVAMAAKKKAEKEAKWSDEYIENLPDSSFLYVERGGNKDSEGRTFPRNLRHFPVKDDKGLYDKSKLEAVLEEAGKVNLPTPVLKSVKKTVTTLLDRIEGGASLEEISQDVTIAHLENKLTEDDTVELEELKSRVAELEAKLTTAESSLAEKEQALTEALASIEAVKTDKDAMASELETLRTFKNEFDAEVAKAEKIEAIKTKFAEAGLQKDESYFADNSEKLLSLDEASLEFMVQEFVAFTKMEGQASLGTKVPNLPGSAGEYTVSDIAKALKERKSK